MDGLASDPRAGLRLGRLTFDSASVFDVERACSPEGRTNLMNSDFMADWSDWLPGNALGVGIAGRANGRLGNRGKGNRWHFRDSGEAATETMQIGPVSTTPVENRQGKSTQPFCHAVCSRCDHLGNPNQLADGRPAGASRPVQCRRFRDAPVLTDAERGGSRCRRARGKRRVTLRPCAVPRFAPAIVSHAFGRRRFVEGSWFAPARYGPSLLPG